MCDMPHLCMCNRATRRRMLLKKYDEVSTKLIDPFKK